MLKSPDVDAVAIITPVWTHFDLAKAALENGKHVFVEKPFTSTSQQAEELIELAEQKNLRIMVDHTFLFSGAVRKIREIVDLLLSRVKAQLAGQQMELIVTDAAKDAIIVKPAKPNRSVRGRHRIEDLVAAMPKRYKAAEFGWDARGREVW